MTGEERADAAAVVVDARGQRCPMPVLELARAVAEAAPGSVVTVLSDDPATAADVPAWCDMKRVDFLGSAAADGGGTAYSVRAPG